MYTYTYYCRVYFVLIVTAIYCTTTDLNVLIQRFVWLVMDKRMK